MSMKIRIKFPRRLTLEKFFLMVAVLCVTSFALLEHVSIPIPIFSLIKMPILYLGGVCLLSQLNMIVKTFMKKKYFYLWITLLLLWGFLFVSAYLNKDLNYGTDPIMVTFRLVLYMVELFVLMIWVCEKQYDRLLLKFLFWYLLILVVATDVLLFTELITFQNGRYEAYLVGTKFSVSYLHMNFLTLWFMQGNKVIRVKQFSKLWMFLAIALMVVVSLRVECLTGVFGCITLFIMLFILDAPNRNRLRGIVSPLALGTSLGINLGFSFISELVLSIPFVNYFIVQILQKSDTLTGRTNIFVVFSQRMQDHWLLGYGYGNSAAVELFGYANAQNALLQWIMQGGLLGTLLLTLFFLQVFKQATRSENKKQLMPLVVLVYVYIFLGMVETTFSMSFLMWVSVIFMLSNKKPEAVMPPVTEKGEGS